MLIIRHKHILLTIGLFQVPFGAVIAKMQYKVA